MLRDSIKTAQEALDECYAAVADEDELMSDQRERLYAYLKEAEDALADALRESSGDG